jgi:type II secretory pathway predicted ATPase ExeA
MHIKSEDTVSSLFQENNNLENFFTGGGRAEVLVRLQEAISIGVPMLVITGEEGSGKTMLCRMLEQRTAQECIVVYFPKTVESFEDGIRIIAQKLDIDTPGITNGNELQDTIEKIVELLLETGRNLLIILDEAENIYLATLERIRKMLDQMIEAGVYMHVLFSGRPSFLENFDQLLICDFREIEELHFSLEPLSIEETSDYLRSCIDRLEEGSGRDVFSDEVIEKISDVAKGNFRMVNILAEESFATPVDDSSFMVLLDSVAEEKGGGDAGWKWPQNLYNVKRLIPLMPWIGGAIGILFVLTLFFSSGDENEKESVVPLTETVERVQEITAENEKSVLPEPEVGKTDIVIVEEKDVAEKEVKPSQEKAALPPVVEVNDAEPKKIIETAIDGEELHPAEIVLESEKGTNDEEMQTTKIVPENQKEIVHSEKTVDLPQQEEPIVELYQSSTLKKKVGISKAIKRSKIKLQPRTEVEQSITTEAHFTVDQLYASRIAAGREWKYGAKDNMYTIQLMVLTSHNAEENLKQMLSQKNYRQHAKNFFIFKKTGSPPVSGLLRRVSHNC